MKISLLKLSFQRPVAVVGDIHGRADLLRQLLRLLPPEMPLITAGDTCDRGPETPAVIDLLIQRGARGVVGNHEEWLLQWASGGAFDPFALGQKMGGRATLAAYGVQGESPRQIEAQAWRVPVSHRQWLEGLGRAIDLEVQGRLYWVAHAGVSSTEDLSGLQAGEVIPWLAENRPALLTWSFNDPEEMLPLDRTVIMGHISRKEPLDTGHTLAIDTGCGKPAGGKLTAVILPERRFLSVG